MKLTTLSVAVLSAAFSIGLAFADHDGSFIGNLPATPSLSVSTVPGNGDVNPYGVAFVPHGFPHGGMLSPGDVLVSNFNNGANAQGTGSTIVRVTPGGHMSTFFQGPVVPPGHLGLGLTTALGVLRRGFVLVGNLPTITGTCTSIGSMNPGSLLVLDRNGSLVTNLVNPTMLDGPWDLAIHEEGDNAQVFVSNALNGTVTRLELKVLDHGGVQLQSTTRIASGYTSACNTAALVVGPTGLAYDAEEDILYIASTGDNMIFAISNARRTMQDAGKGQLVYQDNVHLHGPLALALAPNGHLLTADGDAINADPKQPSEIVEFTKTGQFVSQLSIDPLSGGAFGFAVKVFDDEIRFAAVDDNANALDIFIVKK